MDKNYLDACFVSRSAYWAFAANVSQWLLHMVRVEVVWAVVSWEWLGALIALHDHITATEIKTILQDRRLPVV